MTGIFKNEQFPPFGPTGREARILTFQFLDGSWRLTSELIARGTLISSRWLEADGGDQVCFVACFETWERWEGAP